MVQEKYPPAKLIYGNNILAVEYFDLRKSEADRGNPYNTAFCLRVSSGAFQGYASCEYDIVLFCKFVEQLRELYDFRRRTVELSEFCYGSQVVFTLEKAGQLAISGELFGEAKEQSLRFSFKADQTALLPFVNSLEKILHNECQEPAL